MKASTLLFVLLAAVSPLRAQERLGFRVQAWVEWDAQRIDLGEGYVSGPHGVGIVVTAHLEATAFTVQLQPQTEGDSTRYSARIEARVAVADSQRPTPLFAIDSYSRAVAVRHGDAGELTLPFHPEPGETATLHLRFVGPDAPRPATTGGSMDRMVREPRGVYFRNAGVRAQTAVTPYVCPGAVAVHLTTAGASAGTDVLACGSEATPVSIPGVPGRWIVMIPREANAGPDAQCLMVSSAPPIGLIGGYQPRSWGRWCPAERDRWSPGSFTLSTGETVRAQLIP